MSSDYREKNRHTSNTGYVQKPDHASAVSRKLDFYGSSSKNTRDVSSDSDSDGGFNFTAAAVRRQAAQRSSNQVSSYLNQNKFATPKKE